MRFLLAPLVALTALVAADAPSAEVKVGTGVEKMALQGEATSFKVAANTKIYVWTAVTGAADSTITVSFEKDGKQVFKQELKVSRSPYRTWAYRTFRAGDSGKWTAKVLGADGKALGEAAFTVEVEK